MEAGDLYGLPLERFVPERTALAKALRQEGKREEAAEVTKLQKPSRAAWAVNQLVRTQGRTISSLFQAGDALQRAQADVIAGRGDARKLRDAADKERAAVKRLADAARGLLSAEGHALTASTVDRVSETFHAAALDEDARKQVEQGCLERELRHVGLGGPGGLTMPSGSPSRASPKPSAGRGQGSTRAASDEAERQAEEADRRRADQLRAAQEEETEARQAVDRAAKQLHAAEQRRDRAAEALSAAEDALAEAQTEADRTERAHEQARQRLDRLRR